MSRRLYHDELEDLVRWFTQHMSQETRADLMGQLPVHYSLLYPGVRHEAIAGQVMQQLEEAASQQDPLPGTRNLLGTS
jgi:hypothetical protein